MVQNNKQVVGYVGTRTCQGFTALQVQCLVFCHCGTAYGRGCAVSCCSALLSNPFPCSLLHASESGPGPFLSADCGACLQMQCATCTVSSSLNNEPWGDAKQGTQGNPSNPQPNLQCTSGNAMVDAASNPGANATLLNMTTALQGVTAYQSSITPTMESKPLAACIKPGRPHACTPCCPWLHRNVWPCISWY